MSKSEQLSIGLITSGGDETQQYLSLLKRHEVNAELQLSPSDIQPQHIANNQLNVWLLDIDDDDWTDELDDLLDQSEVPVFFHERGSLFKQSHPNYWVEKQIERLYEMAGLELPSQDSDEQTDTSESGVSESSLAQQTPSEASASTEAEDAASRLDNATEQLSSTLLDLANQGGLSDSNDLVDPIQQVADELSGEDELSDTDFFNEDNFLDTDETTRDATEKFNKESNLAETDITDTDITETDSPMFSEGNEGAETEKDSFLSEQISQDNESENFSLESDSIENDLIDSQLVQSDSEESSLSIDGSTDDGSLKTAESDDSELEQYDLQSFESQLDDYLAEPKNNAPELEKNTENRKPSLDFQPESFDDEPLAFDDDDNSDEWLSEQSSSEKSVSEDSLSKKSDSQLSDTKNTESSTDQPDHSESFDFEFDESFSLDDDLLGAESDDHSFISDSDESKDAFLENKSSLSEELPSNDEVSFEDEASFEDDPSFEDEPSLEDKNLSDQNSFQSEEQTDFNFELELDDEPLENTATDETSEQEKEELEASNLEESNLKANDFELSDSEISEESLTETDLPEKDLPEKELSESEMTFDIDDDLLDSDSNHEHSVEQSISEQADLATDIKQSKQEQTTEFDSFPPELPDDEFSLDDDATLEALDDSILESEPTQSEVEAAEDQVDEQLSADEPLEFDIPLLDDTATDMQFEDVADEEVAEIPQQNLWVLGASLGGPAAVKRFLQNLPNSIDTAFVLAQHIDENFLPVLCNILDTQTPFKTVIVDEPMKLQSGRVYIAPINHKLKFDLDGTVSSCEDSWTPPYSPCIDDVIESAGQVYQHRCGAIIFSGMGNDGSAGIAKVIHNDVKVWVQSPDTCANSSMPDSVIEQELCHYQGSPEQLADHLTEHLQSAKIKSA